MNYDDFTPNGPSSQYRRFEDDPYPYEQSKAPKILLRILIILIAVFVLITVIALATKKASLGKNYRQSDPTPETVINRARKSNSKVKTTSLGQFRISTKPESSQAKGILLVVSPWFSYPDDDVQLFEEIFQKTRKIKSIITEYFSGHTKSELLSIGEKKVKEELKELINGQLVMGPIKEIYFEQYMFFE